MPTVTHNIILDVDTGIDDAMAIIVATRHPQVNVAAISCVTGNVAVVQVIANTLAVLDAAAAPPTIVARGASTPLIEKPRDAAWIHGPTGLANLDLPASRRQSSTENALETVRQVLLTADEPITYVALAPLTNLALLLRVYPEVKERIGRVVFMGGSASGGNATAVAEFNIWHDPEAASIVINSGLPLVMYGLEVFRQLEVSSEQIEMLKIDASPIASIVGQLLGFEVLDPNTQQTFLHPVIGDAGVIYAITNPELFTFASHPIHVDLNRGPGRGQTIVDRRPTIGDDAFHGSDASDWPVAEIAIDVDAESVMSVFLNSFSAQFDIDG